MLNTPTKAITENSPNIAIKASDITSLINSQSLISCQLLLTYNTPSKLSIVSPNLFESLY